MSVDITAELLRAMLTYDSQTGEFRWKVVRRKHGGKTAVGELAGKSSDGRYWTIGLLGKSYLAHRLAWFYVYGSWPREIDHIDGNKLNNAISNLRECTRSENNQNRRGVSGVSRVMRGGRYRASICVNRKQIHLGCYSTQDEARSAYLEAKKNVHPFGTM
jgi:HNH endonuclease/AP2 domain